VAKALKMPAEEIKNFDGDEAVNFVANTFNARLAGIQHYHQCNFNPPNKYVEALEGNKRLYEPLLKSERKKIELMQKMEKSETYFSLDSPLAQTVLRLALFRHYGMLG
jgi:hypothetical protein